MQTPFLSRTFWVIDKSLRPCPFPGNQALLRKELVVPKISSDDKLTKFLINCGLGDEEELGYSQ